MKMSLYWVERLFRLDEEKVAWHKWFAWRPVITSDCYLVWLQRVWRKGEYTSNYGDGGWDWDYRTAVAEGGA